jgi:hypothetical protein
VCLLFGISSCTGHARPSKVANFDFENSTLFNFAPDCISSLFDFQPVQTFFLQVFLYSFEASSDFEKSKSAVVRSGFAQTERLSVVFSVYLFSSFVVIILPAVSLRKVEC